MVVMIARDGYFVQDFVTFGITQMSSTFPAHYCMQILLWVISDLNCQILWSTRSTYA